MNQESSPRLEYAVYRLNWHGHDSGMMMRVPGQQRIATFQVAEQASADAELRERAIRLRVNPFLCGTAFHYLSTFPVGVYFDWLRDLDIEPPATEDNMVDMAEWWQKTAPTLTTLQREKAWEGLDKVRFFTVRSVDPQRIGYAVTAIQWEYNDAWYIANAEGGAVVKVFRTLKAAERFRQNCEQQMHQRMAMQDPQIYMARRTETRWPFRGNEVPVQELQPQSCYYEIVEVDLA